MLIVQSAFGLLALTAIAWALSENRRAVSWRVPATGLTLQLGLALLLLQLPQARQVFAALNEGVLALAAATEEGTSFVFGYLGGGPLPFEETVAGGSVILAFRALPLVIVVSALTALLTYWRVLPVIVQAFAALFQRSFGVGGAVSLAASANIFVGMVEAPLFVRAYLRSLTRGELFMVMCAGMATIAGTVLLLYVTILGPVLPDAAGHLITASIISAPAAIMVAWLMVPIEHSAGGTAAAAAQPEPFSASSSIDAITQGTEAGLRLYLNIVAMLIVLISLVHLANAVLGLVPDVLGAALTLERMLGWIMAPVVWLMGIPWSEAVTAGSLMGIKTVLNEFLAYLSLAELEDGALSPRSMLIMSYALCGMANFGSLGIMIGGLATLVPERRQEITSLGLKSIVGGTLATCCTGAVVGMAGAW